MARGRMINTTIATDKRLNSMSQDAIMLFVMTVPHLDRDGLIVGDANLLYSRVCPRLPYMLARIEPVIDEWVSTGLVMRYETNEDPVLFFTGFNDNQVGMRYDREMESIYPPPPGFHRTSEGMFPDESGLAPDNCRSVAGVLPESFRQLSGANPLLSISINKDQDKDKEKNNDNDNAPVQTTQSSSLSSSEPSPDVSVDEKTPEPITKTISSMADVSKLRKADTGFDAMCAIYENEIEKITPLLANEIYGLRSHPPGWWRDAIGVAAKAGRDKRKLSYIKGILSNWQSEGKNNGTNRSRSEKSFGNKQQLTGAIDNDEYAHLSA